MTLVGFKRMKIQTFDADMKPLGDLIVIEGKQDKGATTSAEISGLSKEPTKVAGSDIEYYISRKGVGDVKAELGVLDFPEDGSDRVLGYVTDETNKLTYIGSKTEAPYCGVLLESSTLSGGKALLGFLKGTFSRDKISMNTLDPAETYKPEADSYTFSSIASDAEGQQNGQNVVKYIGDDATAIAELEKEVLGVEAPTGDGGEA